jgi:predicted phosphodiesterase
MKHLKIIILLSITIFFNSCDNFFEYSVYEANVKEENKNTTVKNLELLKKIQIESDDFKFAFVTDIHFFYNNLTKVVNDINNNEKILFVIIGGDITEQALLKEYEIFYDIMKKLNKPYLTVIGNHDYNANGDLIYQKMFGDYNYSFEFNNNKFVFFDDVVWESDKNPDFDWLSSELSNNSMFNEVFVIAHIPPSGDQFTNDMAQTYKSIMNDNNVSLSLHGHTHSYFYEQDIVSYLTIPSLKNPEYGIVSIENGDFSIELIEL